MELLKFINLQTVFVISLRNYLEIFDMFHIQCSMLNAQCSMLHAQCSMLNAQCSMLNAPCSMLHAQCSMFNAPCCMLNAQCSMLNASCSMLHAQCSMLNAQCPMLNAAHIIILVYKDSVSIKFLITDLFAFVYTMVSHKCSKCSFATERSYNLRRHLKNVHNGKSTAVSIKTANAVGQLGDGLSRRQPRAEPENGLDTKEEYEKTMATLRGRFPTMNFDTTDPRFIHPFTATIAGPSSSGKSVFCMRLIRNVSQCIAPPPERIVYCYSIYQPLFDQFPNVEFVEGLTDLNMFDGVKRTLLIIDDLMHETNETVSKLFTRISHHKNVSVVYLTQNLFNNNKHNRTISLNAHYMVLFKNVRDATQVHCLAHQMFPKNSEAMMQGYKDATGKPYGYLLVDLTQSMDDRYRLRTEIFPDETGEAYVPI